MSDLPLIFRLMPALYRNGDADIQGGGHGALLALAKVLDEARATIKADIEALDRDWFVETCDPRLLPRLGELVGMLPFEREAQAPRAMVADTIAFRRRKGSIAAIERRLAALAGWPVRLSKGDAPGEVRLDVWRDEALAFARATPRPAWDDDLPPGCYHLDALGRDIQLVNPPRPYPGIEAPFVAALDAPVPLARDCAPDALMRAIAITLDAEGSPLPPQAIVVADLGGWQIPSAADPSRIRAVVDPVLGRLVLLDAPTPAVVAVDYVRGAPARIGGGPYERAPMPTPHGAWRAYVHGAAPPEAARAKDRPPTFATLRAALEAFDAVPGHGMIRILDSGRYDVENVEIGALPDAWPPDPGAPRRLVVEAMGGQAPCLAGAMALRGRDPGLHVTFAGLWIDGTLTLGGTVELELEHCTLHPAAAWRAADGSAGEPAAVAAAPDADTIRLVLRHSLSGPLDLPLEAEVAIADSVVHGRRGPAVRGRARGRIERSTLIGAVAVWRLKATDAIFDGPLDVADRLWGELRTSHLSADARAPRRTECVVAEVRVEWVSLDWGAAGYARLGEGADARVHEGGSEGHAMGAHHGRREARRTALLREGVACYLPPGCHLGGLERIPEHD